jgi:hypothetical protein
MTPRLEAIAARYTLKGWYLDNVLDVGVGHCEYCGARIRYAFKCAHELAPIDTDRIYVGRECVKSFVDDVNTKESIDFLKAKWRQKRTYFWKRFMYRDVIVGTRRDGSWWAAVAPTVTDHTTWTYSERRFKSGHDAKYYVQTYVLTGRPPAAPRALTGADIIAQAKARLAQKQGGER